MKQLLASALAETLAALGAEESLATRAARGSTEQFDPAWAQLPDVEPDAGDDMTSSPVGKVHGELTSRNPVEMGQPAAPRRAAASSTWIRRLGAPERAVIGRAGKARARSARSGVQRPHPRSEAGRGRNLPLDQALASGDKRSTAGSRANESGCDGASAAAHAAIGVALADLGTNRLAASNRSASRPPGCRGRQ